MMPETTLFPGIKRVIQYTHPHSETHNISRVNVNLLLHTYKIKINVHK